MNLQPETSVDFLKKTKESIKTNPLSKFIVLGGAACSVVNGFIGNFLITGLGESIGIGTAGWIASQSLKSNRSMSSMDDAELKKHFTKGACLTAFGVAGGWVSNIFPGPIAHMIQYPTSILAVAGVVAMAESGITKVKRMKN